MKDPYFELPGISNSDLKEFKKSPEHYKYYKSHGRVETEAMAFGSAVHTIVLEPIEFDNRYMIMDESKRPIPGKDYRTAANKEWKDQFYIQAQETNKQVISSSEFETLKIIKDKLYSVEPSKEILEYTRNEYEVALQWQYKGTKCKGKADIISDQFIADLKTTQCADPIEFSRKVIQMEYYRQAGMYLDGDSKGNFSYNKRKDFFFMAIETTAPYGVSVHVCSNALIEKGVEEYRGLVEQLKACYDNDSWGSYDFKAYSRMDGIFELDLPFYLKD